MKTASHHHSTTSLLLFIALAFSATASAFATAAEGPSKTTCTDSRTVVVVKQRSILPNGKGTPYVVRQTKRVCTACAGATAAVKPMLSNGPGARVVTSAPALHECGDCR